MAMAPALSQRMWQQLWNAEAKAIVAGAAALRSRSPGGSPLASQGYMTGVRLAALDGARAGCRGNLQCVRAVGLFFGTQTGKTEDVASAVGEAAGVGAEDIGEKSAADLAGYDGLIVGLPTWNTGADSERSGTAWDEYLEEIKTLDLCGKPGCLRSGRLRRLWRQLLRCNRGASQHLSGCRRKDDWVHGCRWLPAFRLQECGRRQVPRPSTR